MRTEALLFGGMIKQDQGFLEDARRSWFEGLEQANGGTFLLYQLQHNIGASYEKEGEIENALHWYRSAVQTCAIGDDFSCDQTLTSLLSLLGGQIPQDDEAQIIVALEKSWKILELAETPNRDDLPEAINKLTEQFSKLVSEIMEDGK